VVHSKLLHKLKTFGINGLLLKWITGFLHGRSQCVVVENRYSSWSKVISGVPLGSVLGPILFVLFIYDISTITVNGVFTKFYADDLKLYTSLISNDDSHNLQDVLSNLLVWSKDWQLEVNVSKSHVLHLVGRCGIVGSTLAFGFIVFESEHRLFSHHGASALIKLMSLAKCSLDDSVRRLL